jgi:hypothetical protein
MPATKTQSKKERKAFSAGSVAARLVAGQKKVSPLRDNNYKAILGPDGKKVAQVSDRASGAILEGLPDDVEAFLLELASRYELREVRFDPRLDSRT